MPYLPTQTTTLPAPATLPPQAQFTRERQVRFLEALSVSGKTQAACRSACLAPKTVIARLLWNRSPHVFHQLASQYSAARSRPSTKR